MSLTMTEAAARHIGEQLAQRGHGLGIRVGIRTAGCSGLAYVLEFVDQPGEKDRVFEEDGVRVYVDPKSLVYLDGTEMDFVREGVNEGFQFKNPNAVSECGCGESFQI
jgi:iron-sulfur cluster assembly protein